ncbi:cell division protein FtsZ [Catalinimonas alkaloidigena]|uniref:cell division protein FtsZ n=1 Tax=Catalinimonas alkaloidigena TaxID=1075417 RepID=UPI0024067AB6|nr:cell division protein FtsZ [Catalinimonas alkaloidigena]MDF9801245.1 cell division protein FtsZ [Catalinimonas alkaloidigena]
MADRSYEFDLPTQHKSIIKVIGVGGGGSNAVNHMYNQGIKDVEFIICNTDAQALEISPVPNKLQIGGELTRGLGAGANPEKGKAAAIESKEEIRELLSNDTRMLFITAGMGGGTGTGAAPEIAKVARELGVLTVGIVTQPFAFEGKKKQRAAEEGIRELRNNCDTVIVILNDKLREVYGNLTLTNAFAQADNILTTAAKSIAEIITVPGYINVDFEDVKTVMAGSGAAVMGSAKAEGEHRAMRAAEEALSSPLLDDKNIKGARKILLSIRSGEQAEMQMDELTEITDHIQTEAGEEAEVIFGHGLDDTLGDAIMVTVIATGFNNDERGEDEEETKRVYDLDSSQRIKKEDKSEASPPDSPPQERSNTPSPPSSPPFEIENFEDEEEEDDNQQRQEKEEEEKLLREMSSSRRYLMMKEAYERKLKLKGRKSISSPDNSEDIFKKEDFYNEPAYVRRNIHLYSAPSYNDRNVSRYSLDDDDNIIGNNKFLHDNVD